MHEKWIFLEFYGFFEVFEGFSGFLRHMVVPRNLQGVPCKRSFWPSQNARNCCFRAWVYPKPVKGIFWPSQDAKTVVLELGASLGIFSQIP